MKENRLQMLHTNDTIFIFDSSFFYDSLSQDGFLYAMMLLITRPSFSQPNGSFRFYA